MSKAINFAANLFKVGAIWLADALSDLFDPFEEFTRPEELRYHEWLWEKAQKFEKDMEDFWWPWFQIYRYKLPTDAGDQCLWHGVATAVEAIRNATLKGDSVQLRHCMDGLRTFFADGVLIRGHREDFTYEENVSNDQATGFLLGVYFGWKYGDDYCRATARELIDKLAFELMFHGNKLVNADGAPTPHGRLENGYLTDPLNITCCMVTYLMAYRIIEDTVYKQRYDELVRRYWLILPYAKVKLLWWDEQQAYHRAAIHYSILCDLEKEHDTHRKYLKGLLRTWRMCRKTANPWVYYLMRRACLYDPAYEERAKKHLKEMYLENKQWNVEKINSDEVATVAWGRNKRSLQPLPRWAVGSEDFFWQRDLRSVDDWQGNHPGDPGLVRHSGLDFLAAYWGLRSLRIISAEE